MRHRATGRAAPRPGMLRAPIRAASIVSLLGVLLLLVSVPRVASAVPQGNGSGRSRWRQPVVVTLRQRGSDVEVVGTERLGEPIAPSAS